MNNSKKSRSVAFLLAAFLGTFGAHRFYVGKGGTGAVMLILTISAFGVVVSLPWAILDFFFILFGAFSDSSGSTVSKW